MDNIYDDTKASLTIISIRNDCSSGCKSTYQLRISNIKNLTSHLSEEFEQGDKKWKIGANLYYSMNSDFFGIDLVGIKPCEIRMVVRLFSNDRTKKVQKVLGPKIVDTKGFCIENVIPMGALLKPENEFVKDDSVIVDVEITDGKYLTTSSKPELHKLFSESSGNSAVLSDMIKFFGRNQTNLKIKNMMKSCKDGCVTTLQMTVTNIKNLTSHRWETFKQKDISWKIGVVKYKENLCIEFIPNKSCKTRIVAQLQSWNQFVEPIERTIIEKFDPSEKPKSIEDFILWDQLTHYKNGFIKDSSIIFEVEMTDGVYLDDPHDEEYFESDVVALPGKTSEPTTKTEAEPVKATEFTAESEITIESSSEPTTTTELTAETVKITEFAAEPETATEITAEPEITTEIIAEPGTTTEIEPETILQTQPEVRIGIDNKIESSPFRLTCKICELNIDRQEISSLACGHIFCSECIQEFVKENHICPECRNPAIVDDLRRIILPKAN